MSESLRRSKRSHALEIAQRQRERQRKKLLSVPNPPHELAEEVKLAYKIVRRNAKEERDLEVKAVWSKNRDQLGRDIESINELRKQRIQALGDHHEEGPAVLQTLNGIGRLTEVEVTQCGPDVTDTQRVPIHTLPWLDSIPPVVAWTAIPFNVAEEDGKYLTNIPFLGDELIDKDKKFIDDIVNIYQGKLHGLTSRPPQESLSIECERLDNKALLEVVKILERICAKKKPEVVSDLTLIFEAISSTLPGNGTVEELRCRYQSTKDIEDSKKEAPHPQSGPSQDPKTYTIPNIDGEYAKDLPREKSMHAFQCLFCRRCYQYDCTRGHNGDDHLDLSHVKKTRSPQAFTINYECENANCWRKSPEEFKAPEDDIETWSPGEKSMFRALYPSFPDLCYVAKIMLTKDCQQIRNFAEKETQKDQTTEGGGAGVINTPATSSSISSLPSRKRPKKSSSVSKKNLSRRWINGVKKRREDPDHAKQTPLPPRFMPCQHHNDESPECDEKNPKCYCAKNGTSCEKFCSCPPTCKLRFPGCRCTSTCDSRRCVCFVAARECDPDLCTGGCGANEDENEKRTCRNVNIQRRLHKHLLMGHSDVAGWGIFIKDDVQKGEFIAEYRGEIISHDESERRGHIYDKLQHTFLFELNDHFVVDATRKGNKARFVNSSKAPNCEVKRMLVNGDHRIGIYAKRAIDAGEELFYDYEDVLEKQQRVAAAMGLPKV